MKIQGRKSQRIGAVGPVGLPLPAEGASGAEEAPPAGDRVEIAATQLRKLNEAVQAMPCVRLEKVEGLRDAVDEGSYHVESEKLARKVVDEVLTEALLQAKTNL